MRNNKGRADTTTVILIYLLIAILIASYFVMDQVSNALFGELRTTTQEQTQETDQQNQNVLDALNKAKERGNQDPY